jgi:hypothetical protein
MSDLVRIWATPDPFEAEMIRGRLEAEGIDVLLKGEGEGPYRIGPAYLFVPTADEADARTVLEAISSGAYALEVDDAATDPDLGDADATA